MSKKNKVARISLIGGLIGALTTNPRKALEDEIDKGNNDGWNAIHIEPHSTTNLFVSKGVIYGPAVKFNNFLIVHSFFSVQSRHSK